MVPVDSGTGMRRARWVLLIAALATVSLIAVGIRQSLQHSCEVCMTFEGRTACRSAAGATIEEARRTAIQNACAAISAGMTQTVQCQNKRPDSGSCN